MATDFLASMKILEKGDVLTSLFVPTRMSSLSSGPWTSANSMRFCTRMRKVTTAVPADHCPHAIEQELPPCLSIFASTTTS